VDGLVAAALDVERGAYDRVSDTSRPPACARSRHAPSLGMGRYAMKAPLGATGTVVPLISSAAWPVPRLP
jgi:hypothetical protein